QLLPFHANLLQAAVVTDAPVLPVALRYTDAATGLRSDAPVYIGNTTLLASLWRTLRQRGLQARVRYGEPDAPQGRDRRTWAQGARSEIERLLAL
ncbi:MAG TPA: 1-acyl-sn-glycerol-3-phosphate acyltransferase, partial [Macromonas sp.]|nr:1-acyl-sn-glycerol-3-phosphate acyltransferase [Macromonas sp.]